MPIEFCVQAHARSPAPMARHKLATLAATAPAPCSSLSGEILSAPWIDTGDDVNDADQDRDPSRLAPIPSPTSGAGSADLSTVSDDPKELRTLLDRARERLIFYESYDRIIGENIRRTGELMLESIAVREQARAQAERADAAQAELAARIESSRNEHRALVASLREELDTLQAGIDRLRTRLDASPDEAKPSLASSAPSAPARPQTSPADEHLTKAPPGATAPTTSPLPSPQGEGASEPLRIDVIAQGVTSATTALSLQRFLGKLNGVIGVEAREFAEGILRLQVTAHRPLSGGDLGGWPDGAGLRVSQEQPRILEIELSPNAA